MRVGRLFGLTVAAAVMAGSIVVGAAPAAEAKAKPKLRVFNATVSEGSGGVSIIAFSVQLSKPAKKALHFTWRTRVLAGAPRLLAFSGDDFTQVKPPTKKKSAGLGSATIKKGHTSVLLRVKVVADDLDEYTEKFGVHIGGVPDWVNVVDANATGTIIDDDAPPKLRVSDPQVVEGNPGKKATERSVRLELGRPSGKKISLSYTVVAGSAKFGEDLVKIKKPVRVTIGPGHKMKDGQDGVTIKLGVFGDKKVEKNKKFKLVLSDPTHVRLPEKRISMKLLDNDGQPTILGMNPPGPSPNATPLIQGTAPDKSTVAVYLNGTCAGTPVATGTAAAFNAAGIEVSVTPNTTNTLSVKATHTPWGTDSACTAPVTYVHDNIAPSDPTLVSDPSSPSPSPDVVITGTADSDSHVAVFLDTDCTGTPVADKVSATAFSSPGVSLTGLADGSHTVRAMATDDASNASACVSLSLVIDTKAPDAPDALAVVGGTPTDDSTPAISGEAEAGSTVRLYLNASCSGTSVASGSASSFSSGISLPSQADGDYEVTATATDAALNTSDCSDPLSFEIDTTAPDPPDTIAVLGGDPTSDPTPTITGSAQQGSTVTLYVGSTCTGQVLGTGAAAAFLNDGFTLPNQAGDAHTVAVSARASDAAGNVSDCTPFSFTEDTVANAPTLTSIGDGEDPYSPYVTGTAETGSTVTVFDDGSCAGNVVTTLSASTLASDGYKLGPLSAGSYTYSASQVDAAGNQSPCSNAVSFSVAL